MGNTRPMQPRAAEAGVTLVEILVVLTLIAVTAGVVSYALPSPARSRNLDQEAALLAARLNLAATHSLMTGQAVAMDWQGDAYGFREWQDGDWRAATGAPLSERHRLAAGAVLSDGAGAARGVVAMSPDLLPARDGVQTVWVTSGAARRGVAFDGVVAAVLP